MNTDDYDDARWGTLFGHPVAYHFTTKSGLARCTALVIVHPASGGAVTIEQCPQEAILTRLCAPHNDLKNVLLANTDKLQVYADRVQKRTARS